MTPREITFAEAAVLVKSGAFLVDVRGTAQRGSGVITGAAHGTVTSAAALKAKADACDSCLLNEGVDDWRAASLPEGR